MKQEKAEFIPMDGSNRINLTGSGEVVVSRDRRGVFGGGLSPYDWIVEHAKKIIKAPHLYGRDDVGISRLILEFDSTIYEFDGKAYASHRRLKSVIGRAVYVVWDCRESRMEIPLVELPYVVNAISMLRGRRPIHFLDPELFHAIDKTRVGEEDLNWNLGSDPPPYDSMAVFLPLGSVLGGRQIDTILFSVEDLETGKRGSNMWTLGLSGAESAILTSSSPIKDGVIRLAELPEPAGKAYDSRYRTHEETSLGDEINGACVAVLEFIYKLVVVMNQVPGLDLASVVKKRLKPKYRGKDFAIERLVMKPRFLGKGFVNEREGGGVSGSGSHGGSGERTRACVHWREGHFRRQRYGRGLVFSKKRWIRPVMVNARAYAEAHGEDPS